MWHEMVPAAPVTEIDGPMAVFRSYPANAHGVDYVVGDLHGHRRQLLDELERLGFDPTRDRLFCTGDLIDRGPDSFGTLKLIMEPWFYFVQGNHEEELPLFLECQYGAPGDEEAARETGQDWVYRLSKEDRAYLRLVLLQKIHDAPLVLRVEGESGFWMVHADRGVFGSYGYPLPLVDDARLPFITDDNQLEALLWSRRLLRQIPRHELTDRGAYLAVPGMDWENGVGLTFVGHSYVPKPVLYRSHFFLDTGAGTAPSGRLTVLRADRTNTLAHKSRSNANG